MSFIEDIAKKRCGVSTKDNLIREEFLHAIEVNGTKMK